MATILLTGSDGFIATYFAAEFPFDFSKENNYICTGRRDPKEVRRNGVYMQMDITDAKQVNRVFEETKPDIVVHTAAISSVDECEKNPELCYEVNVTGTKNILEASGKYNARVIFLSSDFVFSGSKEWYEEIDLPYPISEYGKSKWEAEKLVHAYTGSWVIVRPVLVYGVPLGDNRPNILSWVWSSLSQGKQIKVVNDQFRSPTSVGAVCSALWTLIKSDITGVFHISGGERICVYDVAVHIATWQKLDTDLILSVSSAEIEGAELRPKNTCFTSEKAIKLLDFKPIGVRSGMR